MRSSFIVKTYSPSKLLNELNRQKISVHLLKVREGEVEFSCNSSCEKKVISILGEMEYAKITSRNASGILKFFVSRIAVFSVLFAVVAYTIASSYFVVGTRVIGGDSQVKKVITREINEHFISKNKLKKDISVEEIEAFVEEKFPFVAMTSCRFYGGYVEVALMGQDENKEIEEIKERQIASKFDGVVTRVLLMSGTSLVKTGDRVLTGDTLIDGKYTYDQDPYDNIPPVEHIVAPRGEVYGSVWYAQNMAMPIKGTLLAPTGRSVKVKRLVVGDAVIIPPKTNFQRSQTVIKKQTIKGFFPLNLYTVEVYEMREVDDKRSIDERRVEIIFEGKQLLKETLPKNAKFIREWTVTKILAGVEYIDIYCEVEQRIDIA